jgi:heme/copper-type cytochrome/quinol oxidase subunit 2
MTTIELLQAILMYGVVPLWAVAGLADYLCHRASRIEDTSGPKESVMHLLELIEAGGPLLAVLFLEVNAGILLLMLVALVVHQATAVWDVRYANQTRRVSPAEQHVHGIMEMLPAMAVVVVAVIHWPAFLSLFGHGDANYAIELNRPPLPGWYLASVLAVAAAVGCLYLEELARTLHARARRVGVT